MAVIYKIFRADEYAAFEQSGETLGAPIDLSDGYIHMSTGDQVGVTAAKHFAGEGGLKLLAIESDGLGPALKWEVSRGGALFPHLYRPLRTEDILWVQDLPFQNGPVRGKDVFVPLEALIGGVEMAGQGWRMLIECLSVGRAITLPATSTGGNKMIARATGAYASIRKQFNLPIGRFEGVEAGLARIAANTYATSALSRMTATAVDLGEKPAVPSAIAKYHTTEMARKTITDAMDIHGAKGVVLGPRNYLGRAWEGIPVSITVEGANILTRNLMIFGQGAIRCHPYVLKEMQAARIENPRERVAKFDHLLFSHIGYSIRNAVRAFALGLSFGKFASVPHDRKTAKYYQKLTRYSAALAFVSDISMLVLGGKLKQKEHLSARLGDVLSLLYITSAMLKRYEAQGRPAADQAILAWAFHNSIYKIQQALRLVVDNFPNRYMRALLRFVVFPFGRREKAPGDRLTHKVAQLLLAPSDTRDRLTQGVYKSETFSGEGMAFADDHQIPLGVHDLGCHGAAACEDRA